MRSPLEDALELLRSEVIDPRAVVRADVDSTGALVLRLSQYSGERWLRREGRRLVEIEPAVDARLPLSAALGVAGEAEAPELLAYRPGRRLVIRRRTPEGTFVDKGYRRRRWRAAAMRHRIAWTAATTATDFETPRVVACEPASASLRLEYLEGRSISLADSETDGFFAVGVALRSFQEKDTSGELPLFGPSEELEVVKRWAARSRALTGWEPEGWSQSLGELVSALGRLPDLRPGLAHRDLHDGQLMETEAGVGWLDFDLLCRADNCLDPANLLAHLTLRCLQARRGATEAAALACGLALLEGLARSREIGFWRRLRFYQTTAFYRLAFVYSLRPCWRELSPALLEYGRRCFEEVA